jgi:lipoprotein NlpI
MICSHGRCDDLDELVRQATAATTAGESRKAVELWSRVLAADGKRAEAFYWRGRERFKLGEIDESMADFDEFARLRPERERELWERGICYYYAGKFEQGAQQFERYQTYQDNDVENSAWRYLCMARKEGVEKARAALLPIRRDPRVPMMEIFALYGGKGSVEDVLKAAEAGDVEQGERSERRFFAHLYVGLYYEAAGESAKAREHILLAADKYGGRHYMKDVARIHAARLREKK